MLFVARKIFSGGEAGQVSASAVRIATAGVAVGILVMIISICVTIGFQNEIKDRVASVIGHGQVVNAQGIYRDLPIPIQITDSMKNKLTSVTGVQHIRRFVLCPGMLKTRESFRGVMFRGVDSDFDKAFISSCLLEGCVPSFGVAGNDAGDTSYPDSILVSSKIASAMGLQVGQRVYAYFFDSNLRVRKFLIAGIFQTYLADYDTQMCYADSRTIQKLSRWENDQYSGAEILLDGYEGIDSVYSSVSEDFFRKFDDYGHPYAVVRVDELFPQVFSWLDLLDTNVIAILILMLCVAGVTTVSGLLIIILERTSFIGVMKAMGATNGQLRRVFLYLAAMIVVRGMISGNIIAIVLLSIQKYTGIISLDPENYYLDTVPVCFPWMEITMINVIVLVVCVLVLVIPTYVISNIRPAKSMRYE